MKIFTIVGPVVPYFLLYRLIRGLKTVQSQWRYIIGLVGVLIAAPCMLAVLYVGLSIAVNLMAILFEAASRFLGAI